MSRLEELRRGMKEIGVTIATYSPGDGVTRYRFTLNGQGYFQASGGDNLATALGIAEAETLANGLMLGYWLGKEGDPICDACRYAENG